LYGAAARLEKNMNTEMKANRGYAVIVFVLILAVVSSLYFLLDLGKASGRGTKQRESFLELIEIANLLSAQIDLSATLNASANCLSLNLSTTPTVNDFNLTTFAATPPPNNPTFPLLYNTSSIIPTATTYDYSGSTGDKYVISKMGRWSIMAACVKLNFPIATTPNCVGINVAVLSDSPTPFVDPVTHTFFAKDPLHRSQGLSWRSVRATISPSFGAAQSIPSGVYCYCDGTQSGTCQAAPVSP
jgi:hypothetical protein